MHMVFRSTVAPRRSTLPVVPLLCSWIGMFSIGAYWSAAGGITTIPVALVAAGLMSAVFIADRLNRETAALEAGRPRDQSRHPLEG